MATPHPNPDSDTGPRVRPNRPSPPSTPRWVKVSAVVVIVLVLAFVILHLTGGGFGHHAPLIQHWVQTQ